MSIIGSAMGRRAYPQGASIMPVPQLPPVQGTQRAFTPGVSLPPQSQAALPAQAMGAMAPVASLGRNGDTELAHVTPGDMVVPQAAVQANPGIIAQAAQGISQIGGDPRRYVVGAGKINPATGVQEFADPVPTDPTLADPNATTTVPTGTINGGTDPNAVALANGGPTDVGTGPVTYSYLDPSQYDGYAPLSGGSYVGMPIQSDVQGASQIANQQIEKSPYLEGYAPNNLSSFVDPSVGTTAFSLNSAITQPGKTDMGGNILLDSDGHEVARWETGVDPATSPPTVINAGYSYVDGKLVADPNSSGYRVGLPGADGSPGGLVSLAPGTVDPNSWGAQHPPTYLAGSGPTTATGGGGGDGYAAATWPGSLPNYGVMTTQPSPTTYKTRNGIVSSAMASTPTNSTGQYAQGSNGAYQLGAPTPWNVTPDQTVEGRIASIINPNNPLEQQAEAQAKINAAAMGQQNTSMAGTAGQAALYQAALPIASADAATFGKAAGYSVDQKNQFAAKNVDALNTFGLTDKNNANQQLLADKNNATTLAAANINSKTQLGTAQISAQTQMSTAQLNADSQQKIAQLDAANRTAITGMQNTNQVLLNTNQQASQAFNQALVTIANINQNNTMDAAAKTQAVAQVRSDLTNQLSTLSAVSGLDLTSKLNFANTPGFDGQGNYVGFPSTPATPAATPGIIPSDTGGSSF